MAPIIDQDLCHCCGTCYDICPQDVFGFREDEMPTIDYPDECWYCGACVLDCPVDAVVLAPAASNAHRPLPCHLRRTRQRRSRRLAKSRRFFTIGHQTIKQEKKHAEVKHC